MKLDDTLYYTLADPTGTSLVMTNENGEPRGHLLYDAYGGVLSSSLTFVLEEALADQGSLLDPDTGLVHLGGGRWYDPGLGRPLQPDPVGGPPVVPQALNRYAATSVGQPGVGQTASSNAFNWTPHAISLMKNWAVESTAKISVRTGYRHTAEVTFEIIATKSRLTDIFGQIELVSAGRTVGRTRQLYKHVINVPVAGSSRGQLYAEAVSEQAKLLKKLPGRSWAELSSHWPLGNPKTKAINGLLGDLAGFKGLKTGFAFGLDALIGGGFQYLDDLQNPYLREDQRLVRAGISGTGGATFAVIATLACIGSEGILCPVVAGSIGGLAWLPFQDTAFSLANRFTSRFGYSILPQRNLKPLQN
jgi:RHS repeat-associated protein